MTHEWLTLEELAAHLGRDRREIEKLVSRGRIPGRKVRGEWQFHSTEITHWIEQEMRAFTDRELQNLEASQVESTSIPVHDLPVSGLMNIETMQIPLKGKSKRSILTELIEVAGRTWHVWKPDEILAAVNEREDVLSTAFENGVALPHPRNPVADSLGESVIAFGKSWSSVPFGEAHGYMTDMFFLVLCVDSRTHLRALARLARMLQLPDFVENLRAAEDAKATYNVIYEADELLSKSTPAN